MAVRYKYFIPDQTYFITFTILGWRNIFVSDEYCDLVYKWFDYMKIKYGDKVYSYVIMPNHVHVLLYVSDKSPKVSSLIQNAKRFLAYQIIELLRKDGNLSLLNFFEQNARTKDGAKHKIFEDRYDSLLIQGDKLFLEKFDYIHNNPCAKKWMLADRIENYKYSSASNYILGNGNYPVDMPQIIG